MKKLKQFFITMLLVLSSGMVYSQVSYDKYFTSAAMRFDFMHAGGMGTEAYYYVGVAKETVWGGNPNYLIDTTHYGIQMLKVLDAETKEIIFTKCYNTLFNEWLDTDEALKEMRSYPESVQFPFPKRDIVVEIYTRSLKDNSYSLKFSQHVSPESYNVSERATGYKSFDIQYNGHHAHKVDFVILSEGYAADEEELFKADCEKFTESIFAFSPFKERRSDFNVRAVWVPSLDSGVTVPGEHTWRSTAFNGKFYTFDSERYFTIENYTKVSEAAGTVPYDAIYILGNTLKYGGGGIYNFYAMGSARNKELAGEVHIHEIGHSFAALADEYATPAAVNEYFSSHREPWEENVTTLADFSKKKIWNSLLKKGTAVPTPVTDKNMKIVGVFEGAGYQEKGVYRPVYNCMMRTLGGDKTFCPVCSEAMSRMIDRYTK